MVDNDSDMWADGIPHYYWKTTEHKQRIRHLNRSILIWHDVISKFPELNTKYHDKVMHDILAHHASKEYGSPILPQTRNAWLLHLCDAISARMDDAETNYDLHPDK